MKKHTTLLLVLGLSEFAMHANIFGAKKPFAKLSEEELDLIEAALQEKDTSALDSRIEQLEADLAAATAEKESFSAALNAALEQNGLGIDEEGATSADAVKLLGDTCKEFGDAKTSHSVLPTDGKDQFEKTGLKDGYYDPKAPHNQI